MRELRIILEATVLQELQPKWDATPFVIWRRGATAIRGRVHAVTNP